MQRITIKINLLILIAISTLFPQQYNEGSPEWLVDMFFNSSNFPEFFNSSSFLEKSYYYTGEMITDKELPTIGEELSDSNVQVLFYNVKEEGDIQIFAVELELNEQVIDFYCYLKTLF